MRNEKTMIPNGQRRLVRPMGPERSGSAAVSSTYLFLPPQTKLTCSPSSSAL